MRPLLLGVALCLAGCASMGGPSEISDEDRANLTDLIQTAEREYTLGNLKVADELLKQAESLAPDNDRVAFRRGTIAYHLGDLPVAAEFFERCLKSDPANAKAHYNLATIRLSQSSEHFRQFLVASPPQANRKPIDQLLQSVDAFAERSDSAGRLTRTNGQPSSIDGAIKPK